MQAHKALLPAYLITGENQLKRNEAIARLKRYLVPGFEDFNLDERLQAQTVESADLIASLNTFPMGEGPRLVIVHDGDNLGKDVYEALCDYLLNPNETTTLAVIVEKLAKNTRLYKAFASLDAKAIINCEAIQRRDLPSHVQNLARTQGITIGFDAANELISRIGESPLAIKTQLLTLAGMFGANHNLTVDEIQRYVARSAEVKPWEFLDAVCERDAKKALSLLAIMPNKRFVALLSLLLGRIRELSCARSLMDRKESNSIAQELKKPDWLAAKYIHWAERYSQEDLAKAFCLCARCERVLKGVGDDETAFTELVLSLC